jgi:hypothetical protein
MIWSAPELYKRILFGRVDGTIVGIEPTRISSDRINGCMTFYAVEDSNGEIVHFLVSSNTYVLDFETLHEGRECSFFYRQNAPLQTIEPPQFKASVIAPWTGDREVYVGYFNQSMVNTEQTLQLKIESSVQILTTNNQIFLTSPANQNLVVEYESATKSLPAQTVPRRIITLCR